MAGVRIARIWDTLIRWLCSTTNLFDSLASCVLFFWIPWCWVRSATPCDHFKNRLASATPNVMKDLIEEPPTPISFRRDGWKNGPAISSIHASEIHYRCRSCNHPSHLLKLGSSAKDQSTYNIYTRKD